MKNNITRICRRLGSILLILSVIIVATSFTYWAFLENGNRLTYYEQSWRYEETNGPADAVKISLDRNCALPYAKRRLEVTSQALSSHLAKQPIAGITSNDPLQTTNQTQWIEKRQELEEQQNLSDWLVQSIGRENTFLDNSPGTPKTHVATDYDRYFLTEINHGYFRKIVSEDDFLAAQLGLLVFDPLSSEEILHNCQRLTNVTKVYLPEIRKSDLHMYVPENKETILTAATLALSGFCLIVMVRPLIVVASFGWSWLIHGRSR